MRWGGHIEEILLNRPSIRVGTFNIKVGVDSSLSSIASDLCQLRLSLSALQEVGRHWSLGCSLSQHRYLASAQGHPVSLFAPTLERSWSLDPYRGGPFLFDPTVEPLEVNRTESPLSKRSDSPLGHYGIALTLDGRVGSVKAISLPRESDEPRAAIYAHWSPMGMPHRNIHVLSVHLSVNPAERVQQAKRLCEVAKGLKGPMLLLGDLNDVPSSEVYQLLTTKSGLFDLAPPRLRERETFSVKQPNRRIDYILGRGVEVLNYQVVDLSVSSDHYPVWAEIIW